MKLSEISESIWEIPMRLKRVSIAVEHELWTKIIAMATAHDRSTSKYVRLVLRDHIKSLGLEIKNEREK